MTDPEIARLREREVSCARSRPAMPSNLSIKIGRDGTWLRFSASNGKQAALRIESLAENKVGIIGMALRQWCADRRAESCPCDRESTIDPQCAAAGQCTRVDDLEVSDGD